jgi:hypothetical protein
MMIRHTNRFSSDTRSLFPETRALVINPGRRIEGESRLKE